MTTTCALLAGIPLLLGTGIGSEIRQPLGYAIVGGLLVQLLTLFTTPVLYLYMDRFGRLLRRLPGCRRRGDGLVHRSDLAGSGKSPDFSEH